MTMRINKFFTDQGYCSRREADKYIEGGRVKINGRVAVLGEQVNPTDRITLDGKPISFNPKKVYIMYNKPKGITCTTELKVKGNIISDIKHPLRIFPIGRLDKDSTGLIFLTNDGDIVNLILRAQFGHEKEYHVSVNKPFEDKFLDKMSRGVDIGDHHTLPCKIKKLGPRSFSIILTEGKNRQIRRMCQALGFTVTALHRIRIMNIKIGALQSGEWADIPEDDLSLLKSAVTSTQRLDKGDSLSEMEE